MRKHLPNYLINKLPFIAAIMIYFNYRYYYHIFNFLKYYSLRWKYHLLITEIIKELYIVLCIQNIKDNQNLKNSIILNYNLTLIYFFAPNEHNIRNILLFLLRLINQCLFLNQLHLLSFILLIYIYIIFFFFFFGNSKLIFFFFFNSLYYFYTMIFSKIKIRRYFLIKIILVV